MNIYQRLLIKYKQNKFHIHFALIHGYAALLATTAVAMHLLAMVYHIQMHRILDKIRRS